MQTAPDRTDLNIIDVLRTNPRITNKEIAATLDLAETTVAQRIRAMAEHDVMRVIAQKHVFADGFTSFHFIFINTTGKPARAVGEDITQFDNVLSVSLGIGNPELFVSTRARSTEDAHLLATAIGNLDGVETMEVVPCFKIHKYLSAVGELSATRQQPRATPPDKDDAIIQLLLQDGRQSNREVARQLSISEGAIRQRLKKLQQSGTMQFQVVCSPAALALNTIALARIRARPGYVAATLKVLVDMEYVAFAAEIAGETNIMALLNTPDVSKLNDICESRIRCISGVREIGIQLLGGSIEHQYHLSYFDALQHIPRRK